MKMKWMLVPALCVGLLTMDAVAQKTKPAKGPEMKTQTDSVSYAIGMNLAANIQKDNIEINPAMLAAGLADAIHGNACLTQEQAQDVMVALQAHMLAKQKASSAGAAEKNMKEGQAFLAENKNKPGVKTTASGLQYEVVTEGTGPMPKATDKVKVHYEGRLIDGTVFDSSIKRGQPISFPLNGVIPGWTEGLQLMKVGSKYRFYIPSNLAYGENGFAGSPIGPNATLIFDVELLGIE